MSFKMNLDADTAEFSDNALGAPRGECIVEAKLSDLQVYTNDKGNERVRLPFGVTNVLFGEAVQGMVVKDNLPVLTASSPGYEKGFWAKIVRSQDGRRPRGNLSLSEDSLKKKAVYIHYVPAIDSSSYPTKTYLTRKEASDLAASLADRHVSTGVEVQSGDDMGSPF